MKTIVIVVGVIYQDGKLLVLRRQPERKYYANKWEFVCGYNKIYETLEESIIREVQEETSCIPKYLKRGATIEVEDTDVTWIVIPFLVNVRNKNVVIDSEHTEYKWVDIADLDKLDCVPGVKEDLKAVGIL